MKKKTKAYADLLVKDPKLNHTDAYLMTHNTDKRPTARVNASQLYRKPEVQLYLKEHRKLASQTQIEVLKNAKLHKDELGWQRLASDTSEKILDRTDGKPLTTTNNLNINVSIEEALSQLI